MDAGYELYAESQIARLEERVEQLLSINEKLKKIVQSAVCETCGGVSWDIPLADYCKCEGKYSKIAADAINES